MTPSPSLRSVEIERLSPGRFAATNVRGGRIEFGSGDDADFTPVELLLAAIGGCSSIDVDILTSRRAVPVSFSVHVSADKVDGELGNHLTNIAASFDVAFPDGPDGDSAREVLPQAIRRSHDRLCTVSRTVELASPVAMRAAGAA
jgi:putative redox protein